MIELCRRNFGIFSNLVDPPILYRNKTFPLLSGAGNCVYTIYFAEKMYQTSKTMNLHTKMHTSSTNVVILVDYLHFRPLLYVMAEYQVVLLFYHDFRTKIQLFSTLCVILDTESASEVVTTVRNPLNRFVLS